MGLRSASLRDHLKARARFFASKDRTARLATLLRPDDREREIDANIWAVLARGSSANAFTLLMDLLCDVAAHPEGQHPMRPAVARIAQIRAGRFCLEVDRISIWVPGRDSEVGAVYPLLVCDQSGVWSACWSANGFVQTGLPASRASAVAVFLSQWRDSTTRQAAYDSLSARVTTELQVASRVGQLTPDAIGICSTFVDLEWVVAYGLRDLLLESNAQAVSAEIRRVASGRMEGFWANTRCPDTVVGKRSLWHSYYRALLSATGLFYARDSQALNFSFTSAKEAYMAYTQKLFEIDQHYRQFHESADVVSGRYPDAMRLLDEQVEHRYLNGFLAKLAGQWDAHLQNGLLQN